MIYQSLRLLSLAAIRTQRMNTIENVFFDTLLQQPERNWRLTVRLLSHPV